VSEGDGEERVLCERRDGVALVTLNRPRRKNAFDDAQWREAAAVFAGLRADPDVAVALVTVIFLALILLGELKRSTSPAERRASAGAEHRSDPFPRDWRRRFGSRKDLPPRRSATSSHP